MARIRQAKSILVVDDDEITRLLARRILEGAGYNVIEAVNVESGLAAAMQHAPHLIILDLVMPDASGYDFLDTRTRFNELRLIPVLVMSSLDDRESVSRAMSLSAFDYLSKPLHAKLLLQKTLKALSSQFFPAITFSAERAPKVSVGLNAQIIMCSEAGFILEAPAKLAEEGRVDVQSPLLDRLDCNEVVFKRTSSPAKIGAENLYQNEVSGVGMSSNSMQRIRKIVGDRK